MTELDNVSLYLYSFTSKGINIKRKLIKIVGKNLKNLNKTKSFSNYQNKEILVNKNKVLILDTLKASIKRGERIGLIGANGSGKSTLLKLLSGIYVPTYGSIRGDLFYPMITRDLNVSHDLNGEDASKSFYYQHSLNNLGFDLNDFVRAINENCKIGDYFTKPIKYYSEGMRTRLVFSLLTSVRLSDNLAIDEGFGTGDKAFALQAEKQLEDFLGTSGSLLMASHSDLLLKEFCKRGWVMKKGKILYDGNIDDALAFYDSNEYRNA